LYAMRTSPGMFRSPREEHPESSQAGENTAWHVAGRSEEMTWAL
jgi:hypothetical protein